MTLSWPITRILLYVPFWHTRSYCATRAKLRLKNAESLHTDLQFLVMFRSRFNDALPKSLANFGPQELERDVTETIPGERVEHFLCSILGLLLNRKQDVK